MHEQLVTKMKLLGKNSIFSVRVTINIGPNFITALATGTALCLAALPIPQPLKFIFEGEPSFERSKIFETLEHYSELQVK